MNSKPSLSVLITAYNEGPALRATYHTIIESLKAANITDYEILILTCTRPDGTHDGTPDIAEEVAKSDPRVVHYADNFLSPLGDQYWRGVQKATKEYVMWLAGSDLIFGNSITEVMNHIGESDSIITYTKNTETRPLLARIVSRGFVTLCNGAFVLRFRYYNGMSVHRRDLLMRIPWSAQGHAYMAETIIYMAKSGIKIRELPMELKPTDRKGKAWNLNSVKQSIKSLSVLFWEVQIKGKKITAA
ncbi:glycosyltransferase family 2 protein [Candidatus Parcubacteria bacterium]|nr:glycosyltransferase family 2 protein [Candidatus Parcubacteria bacterium]